MPLSHYVVQASTDRYFRGLESTPPTIAYLTYCTAEVLADGSNLSAVELPGITRVAVPFAQFVAGLGTPTAGVTFTNLPAGDVDYAALVDTAAGEANLLAFDPLTETLSFVAGQSFDVPAANLSSLIV